MSSTHAIAKKSLDRLVANTSDVSSRLAIREFVIEDISRVQEINENIFFVHLRHTFGGPMGFLNAAIAHQKQKDRKDFYLALIDKETSELVGSVMVYNYKKEDRQAEIGYFIDKHSQNCKFATEVCVYAMHYFGEALELETFYATVHPQNIYSKRLLARLGFIQKGDVFISQYKEDEDKLCSHNRTSAAVWAPRVELSVDYKDFLSRKEEVLSSVDSYLVGDNENTTLPQH